MMTQYRFLALALTFITFTPSALALYAYEATMDNVAKMCYEVDSVTYRVTVKRQISKNLNLSDTKGEFAVAENQEVDGRFNLQQKIEKGKMPIVCFDRDYVYEAGDQTKYPFLNETKFAMKMFEFGMREKMATYCEQSFDGPWTGRYSDESGENFVISEATIANLIASGRFAKKAKTVHYRRYPTNAEGKEFINSIETITLAVPNSIQLGHDFLWQSSSDSLALSRDPMDPYHCPDN